MNYFVYGTINSIRASRVGGFLGMFTTLTNLVTLNTGHVIRCTDRQLTDDTIQEGQTRFILTHSDELYYKNSRLCDNVEELETLTKNLDAAIRPAIDSLRSLNKHDRGLVCRALCIGSSTTISVVNAVNCVGQAANFIGGATFDPLAFGVSGAISVGTGVFAVLQVESLSEELKARAKVLRKMQRAHSTYRSLMLRYMPFDAASAEPLNPEVKSFISLLRGASESFTATDFWQANFDGFATA